MRHNLCGLLLAIVTFGCTTTDDIKEPWRVPDVAPIGEVVEVGVIWGDGLDLRIEPRLGAPILGFAGRVYLFGPDHATALAARGSLEVQLYDDAQPPAHPPIPREVWKVKAEDLKYVFKKDGIGWGYNLFLPWNSAIAKVTKVSLVVKYLPDQGTPIWSTPAVLAVKEEGKGRVVATLDTTARMTAPAPAKYQPTGISSFHVPKDSALAPARR